MSVCPRLAAAALVVLVLGSAAALAADPEAAKPSPRPTVPDARAEREAAIRDARREIGKSPRDKKFILFRHGLTEEDLR
jgi:hypothetical protein